MVSDAGAVKGEEPGRAGLWEDFVDIFYAPSSVFARRADGKFGKPLLFLVLVGTVLFFLTKNATQPIMDAEFARQGAAAMRKNPNVTAEQMSAGLQAPPLPVALRSKLLAIPRATVSCEGAERLLPLAIEKELGAEDERRLASHLSRCEGCSEAAAVLFASRELADPIAPPWLAARLTASRPRREKRFWSRLLDPKAAIALAYAAAVVVMLLGFNPADLARRVRVGEIGQNTRAAVTVAEIACPKSAASVAKSRAGLADCTVSVA